MHWTYRFHPHGDRLRSILAEDRQYISIYPSAVEKAISTLWYAATKPPLSPSLIKHCAQQVALAKNQTRRVCAGSNKQKEKNNKISSKKRLYYRPQISRYKTIRVCISISAGSSVAHDCRRASACVYSGGGALGESILYVLRRVGGSVIGGESSPLV